MIVNLYGGPGSGKSTLASWLFSELKKQNYKIELVSEYIKTWAWLKLTPTSWDQFYIFAKQLRAVDICALNNVHVISDSPLLMQAAYMIRSQAPFTKEVIDLYRLFEKDHPSINFLLQRPSAYEKEGRYENLEQALEMDKRIKDLLNSEEICYHEAKDEATVLDIIKRNFVNDSHNYRRQRNSKEDTDRS
jgi:thymidylate kinase